MTCFPKPRLWCVLQRGLSQSTNSDMRVSLYQTLGLLKQPQVEITRLCASLFQDFVSIYIGFNAKGHQVEKFKTLFGSDSDSTDLLRSSGLPRAGVHRVRVDELRGSH